MPSPRLSPRLAVALTILMWGCSFVAAKAALRELSPITLIFTRFALGAALLVVIAAWRGHMPPPPRSDWPMIGLLGFIGVAFHGLLQSYGLTLTTAVKSGWLILLIPIWSALLAAVLGKERFGALKIACLLGGFAGALLVTWGGPASSPNTPIDAVNSINPINPINSINSTNPTSPPHSHLTVLLGDSLIVLSTINWAVYSLLCKGTAQRLGSTRTTVWTMLAGGLMLAPVFLAVRGWREWSSLSAAGWGATLFLGLGCTGLGYLLWNGALEKVELSRVAAFLYAQPLVTLVAGALLLKEPVGLATLLGGAIVLASVFGMQRAPQR
jgi:drug/metabolite transporter (DMT)-like permease